MFQVREQEIIFNEKIAGDIYLMKISGSFEVKEGQFFMLKAEGRDMTLFRPISIFDCDSYGVSFLYSVRGKGTEIFSKMKESDTMLLHGPYGNGFPKTEGKIAMVAGGIGMAPLYLTARRNPGSDLYIGIREDLYSQEELQLLEGLFEGCSVKFKIGGLITEIIDFDKYDSVFTCGPEVMMKAVSELHQDVYVSLEKHMGCGLGACLSCSCKVGGKMVKVCKDGPVFKGTEVNF